MALDEMLARVAVVAQAVDVPVSADLESGYGADPDLLVEGLLAAGAVGVNLEDTVHSDGDRLRTPEEHAEYIRGVREAADAFHVHVVVNARTDILLHQVGEDERSPRPGHHPADSGWPRPEPTRSTRSVSTTTRPGVGSSTPCRCR